MRLIATVIPASERGRVCAALAALDVHDIVLTMVQVFAPEVDRVQPYAGAQYIADSVRQVRIEIAVDADRVASAIAAIDLGAGLAGRQYTVKQLV